MKISEHVVWNELKKYVWKEAVPNQAKKSGERFRRWLAVNTPNSLIKKLQKIQLDCPACGEPYCPVARWGERWYINCGHGHRTGKSCARRNKKYLAAVRELDIAIGFINEPPDPRQMELV